MIVHQIEIACHALTQTIRKVIQDAQIMLQINKAALVDQEQQSIKGSKGSSEATITYRRKLSKIVIGAEILDQLHIIQQLHANLGPIEIIITKWQCP